VWAARRAERLRAEWDAAAWEAQRAITAVRRERDVRAPATLRRDRALFEELFAGIDDLVCLYAPHLRPVGVLRPPTAAPQPALMA
jgi:hypothetical protein